ncbi:hypothetical protein BOTBODRAFT_107545 [Botryobasidium botryosum FD-172 SS1]|uniref:type I protein arginine methyltransferase n=1 Tax=Botryobasidium botryosum (strain FD-172 SS1) TaxID=930990 RepID=A0A067MWU2_BOTB1|nr:hypothetical protein BOTBODRAFT_107545 [Botryobasidium botryosum FD-172 SS1]
MSVHLPVTISHEDPPDDVLDAESSDSESDEDQTFDDWIESDNVECRSLFEERVFPSVTLALEHDRSAHGFDLQALCTSLALDFHQRTRLVNYIRKTNASPDSLRNLTPQESFFTDDEYLIPVVADDPLLQANKDKPAQPETLQEAQHRIKKLEEQLLHARTDVADLRNLIKSRLDLVDDASPAEQRKAIERDDDTHYFQSYGYDEIHAVMIQDTVRTSSYATFILTNPAIFENAVVMDVGCGSGILSMFAAKAGAKHVFAVDASDIALKAEQNIKDNGLDKVITVIRGKVEDIQLPAPYTSVDIIVSEWMGYALLYESMLDSVLHARDRFLLPGGLLAPSQCRIKFGPVEINDILKERVEFWNDVYGFKMSHMAKEIYDEALIDVIGPAALLGDVVTIKDLPLQHITARQLDFISPFSLTIGRDGMFHAFVVYFDTWFTVDGADVPTNAPVTITRVDGDGVTADVIQLKRRPSQAERKMSLGGDNAPEVQSQSAQTEPAKEETRKKEVSFSTGPRSTPTHWKQTLFLLRKPVRAKRGTTVSGSFYMQKSKENKRELDVEIHFKITKPGQEAETTETVVQMYKVR